MGLLILWLFLGSTSDSLIQSVATIPGVSGFMVYQNGELNQERYWRGHGRNRPQNIKSASKTVLSALVGIAIEQGHIGSVDDPIRLYLPDLVDSLQPETKRNITIKHLLTMSSGLSSTSFRNYGAWVSTRDWVKSALDRQLVSEPGNRMSYSTGDTHILSAVLTAATGMSTMAYAQRYLFTPLGVRIGGWDRDPKGIYFGGNNMSLSPAGLLAFGRLYLDAGQYDRVQVVPKDWIIESVETQFEATSYNPRGHNYGYLWWNNEFGGHQAWFAWGYGGQYVFVFPSLDAVVVITGNPDARGRGANDIIYSVMDEAIVPYLIFSFGSSTLRKKTVR